MCKVAIIDDDIDLIKRVARYLTSLGNYEIVGTANNGEQGLRLLQERSVDVALIDLLLPYKDGFYILDELSKNPATMPCCIVISGVSKNKISQKAMEKGAEYFILKPFDLEVLPGRINEVWGWKKESDSDTTYALQMTLKIPETFVLQVLHEMPIPITQEGYSYIKTALLMSINEPTRLNRVTKELYPAVGKAYGIDEKQAERAMRYTINTAWRKGGGKIYSHILGKENGELPRPTVSSFLSALVERYNFM